MAITKIQSESLNLADTYAFTGTVTGAGESNTPYFSALKTSNQTLSDAASATKITFDSVSTESTSGVFDLSNNKFTATVAGKYCFQLKATVFDTANALKRVDCYIYKNGSQNRKEIFFDNSGGIREVVLTATWIEDVAVNDYYEMYVYGDTTDSGTFDVAGNASGSAKETYLSGFLLTT
jgi:hypothetical protein